MPDLYDQANCGVFAQPLRDAVQRFGITDDSVPYFLAQLSVESMSFTHVEESMSYHAQNLLNVLNGRNGITTLQQAVDIVSQGAAAIGEALYGGSWGSQRLGNTTPGDGYLFRGRGLIQITGRSNYLACSTACYADDRLISAPYQLTLANGAANSACWFWMSRALNGLTDVVEITRKINGGTAALAARQAMTDKLLGNNP